MPETKEPLHVRLEHEMRNVIHLTLYFGVWFSALNLLIHETQGREGLPLEAWGFAWIKAALCAKFLLIGQLLIPMPTDNRAGLWLTILPRSFAYLLVVVTLSILEEGVRGMIHGAPFVTSMAAYADGNTLRFLATSWVYWMILVPYLVIGRLLTAASPASAA